MKNKIVKHIKLLGADPQQRESKTKKSIKAQFEYEDDIAKYEIDEKSIEIEWNGGTIKIELTKKEK